MTGPSGRVVIVGLGPGAPGLVSQAVIESIGAVTTRYLRTRRHPSASLVDPAESFDHLYDQAASPEQVYSLIVETLVAAAARDGEILYAVPGSPYVAERTVELLRREPGVDVVVVPSLSFVDLAWDRLGIDPHSEGATLVDGHRFAEQAAGRSGPFLVGQCDSRLVLSEMKLARDDGPAVTVLQRLGLPGERVEQVRWDDLDRVVEPDHLTAVWVPALPDPVAAEFVRFDELVRTLRLGCPWDRAQTHRSLTRHLIEETYEVLDAIDALPPAGAPDAAEAYGHLEEELGDLLFQIGFHAVLAAEAGQFGLADVARSIHDKLVDRHPHVFGPPGHPVPDWEEQKRVEKGRASVMEGVPGHLPSLLYASKVQSKAASVGFDWKNVDGAWLKIREELDELEAALVKGPDAGEEVNEELGDVLFSMVNVARHLGVDPESALRAATVKFRRRFMAMEVLARERGQAVDDSLWDEVKGYPTGER